MSPLSAVALADQLLALIPGRGFSSLRSVGLNFDEAVAGAAC